MTTERRWWRCRGDINAPHRYVLNDGPNWDYPAYYMQGYVSKSDGPFDPTRIHLYHEEGRDPIPTFIGPSSPLFTCKPDVLACFTDNLDLHIKTFEISVDEQPHIQFRPTVFLDLFDYENSRYERTDQDTIYQIRRVRLASAPQVPLHMFGLFGTGGLPGQTIVSDEFKSIYEENGFTGLKINQAWPHPSG